VDAPTVYLGELPPTGADTTVFVWVGVSLLAAGALLVGRRRRTA
jgi:LPXTG-motif cell wall-anchored protein